MPDHVEWLGLVFPLAKPVRHIDDQSVRIPEVLICVNDLQGYHGHMRSPLDVEKHMFSAKKEKV